MGSEPHLSSSFHDATQALAAVVEAVPPGGWEQPSPCEGWTARDVLGHVIETQRDFLIDKGLDLGDAPDLAVDPAAAWRSHSDAVAALVDDEAAMAAPFDGHFGPTTIGETLDRFYVFDMVAHRWDLATASGQATSFSDQELDRLETAIASFGDNIRAPGVCGPAVEVPADADRQTQVLATLGRQP